MKQFLLLFLSALIMISCATKTPTQNLYASVKTLQISYNTSYDTIQDLDSKGYISESKKPEIKALMEKAYAGIRTASNTLKIYIKYPTTENHTFFIETADSVREILNDLTVFIVEAKGSDNQ